MEIVHGYPVIKSEGFVLTRGAMKPQVFESYKAAKAAQEKLPGSTLTYKVEVPEEEIKEILEKRK